MKLLFSMLLLTFTFSNFAKAEPKINEQCMDQLVGTYLCQDILDTNADPRFYPNRQWNLKIEKAENSSFYMTKPYVTRSFADSPTDRGGKYNHDEMLISSFKEKFRGMTLKGFPSTTTTVRIAVCENNKVTITNKLKEFASVSRNTPLTSTTRSVDIFEIVKLNNLIEVGVSQSSNEKVLGIPLGLSSKRRMRITPCEKIN